MEPSELIDPDLDQFERKVLRWGIIEWGGPTRCTDEMAVAMGFESVQDLFDSTTPLASAVMSGAPMPASDWLRVLLATEIVFASNTMGSGLQWPVTAGCTDEETFAALRSIQRKLPGLRQLVGVAFGTRYERP